MPWRGALLLAFLTPLALAEGAPPLTVPLLRLAAPPVGAGRWRADAALVDTQLWRRPSLCFIPAFLGTPPQPVVLQIDTGSSDVVVPSARCVSCQDPRGFRCNASASCRPLRCGRRHRHRCQFRMQYGDGGVTTGVLVQDQLGLVTLGTAKRFRSKVVLDLMEYTARPGLFASKGYDGIFGLGPDAATGSGRKSPLTLIREQHKLANVFAMYPGSDLGRADGTLTLGGIDPRAYRGAIQYTPMASAGCAAWDYCVGGVRLRVGRRRVALPPAAFGVTLVDSGTTQCLLPPTVFRAVRRLFQAHYCHLPLVCGPPGTTLFDQQCIEQPTLPRGFPVLTWRFAGGVAVPVPSAAYLLRVPNATAATRFCLGLAPIPRRRGAPDTTLGDTFMAASYIVFDREAHRLGFARPAHFTVDRLVTTAPQPWGPRRLAAAVCAALIVAACGVVAAAVATRRRSLALAQAGPCAPRYGAA